VQLIRGIANLKQERQGWPTVAIKRFGNRNGEYLPNDHAQAVDIRCGQVAAAGEGLGGHPCNGMCVDGACACQGGLPLCKSLREAKVNEASGPWERPELLFAAVLSLQAGQSLLKDVTEVLASNMIKV
jgi:hypothetical protein